MGKKGLSRECFVDNLLLLGFYQVKSCFDAYKIRIKSAIKATKFFQKGTSENIFRKAVNTHLACKASNTLNYTMHFLSTAGVVNRVFTFIIFFSYSKLEQ